MRLPLPEELEFEGDPLFTGAGVGGTAVETEPPTAGAGGTADDVEPPTAGAGDEAGELCGAAVDVEPPTAGLAVEDGSPIMDVGLSITITSDHPEDCAVETGPLVAGAGIAKTYTGINAVIAIAIIACVVLFIIWLINLVF